MSVQHSEIDLKDRGDAMSETGVESTSTVYGRSKAHNGQSETA